MSVVDQIPTQWPRPFVFISPHLDDVCFSLAGLVSQYREGILVNVFTQTEHCTANLRQFDDPAARQRVMSRIRQREDRLFTTACNLVSHDLMLIEPPLLGLDPFSHVDIDTEVALVERTLVGHLLALADSTEGRMSLFCPMGIGRHRNHVSILQAIVNALPRLQPHYETLFYEDLHYASRAAVRDAGIKEFLRISQAQQPSRLALTLNATVFARKYELVQLYGTQLEPHQGPTDFTPAASTPKLTHEAVWSLSL